MGERNGDFVIRVTFYLRLCDGGFTARVSSAQMPLLGPGAVAQLNAPLHAGSTATASDCCLFCESASRIGRTACIRMKSSFVFEAFCAEHQSAPIQAGNSWSPAIRCLFRIGVSKFRGDVMREAMPAMPAGYRFECRSKKSQTTSVELSSRDKLPIKLLRLFKRSSVEPCQP